jgi:hypothetical protein
MSRPLEQSTPKVELAFDGNPVDLQRLLAHVSVSFLADQSKFGTEQAKSGFLAKHFRGPALDWLAVNLRDNASLLDNFDAFKSAVQGAFGLDSVRTGVEARTRMDALRQSPGGDLLLFLSEFEGLCATLGLASDASRCTLLMPKLEPYYQSSLRTSGQLCSSYSSIKAMLGNMYALRKDPGVAHQDKARRKAKCGKCGRKGHTSTECRSGN